MQPVAALTLDGTGRTQSLIVDLARRFAAAMLDRESCHGSDAVGSVTQRFERFGPTDSKGADHASSHHGDTSIGCGLIRKRHWDGKLSVAADSC
jgi:hypothetical protein